MQGQAPVPAPAFLKTFVFLKLKYLFSYVSWLMNSLAETPGEIGAVTLSHAVPAKDRHRLEFSALARWKEYRFSQASLACLQCESVKY